MKKLSISVAALLVLSFSSSLYADDTGYYLSGVVYRAFENIDENFVVDTDLRYDNSFGQTFKAGYRLDGSFSVEFAFDYCKFKGDSGEGEAREVDLDITAYMLTAKYSPDIGSDTTKPFLAAGLGAIYADFYTVLWRSFVLEGLTRASDSDSDINMGGKIGLGIDFFLHEKLSFSIEGYYTMGFFSLHNIRYFNPGLGIAYHF